MVPNIFFFPPLEYLQQLPNSDFELIPNRNKGFCSGSSTPYMTNNTLAVCLFSLGSIWPGITKCHSQQWLPAPESSSAESARFWQPLGGVFQALGTLLWPMCRDSTSPGTFLRAAFKGMGFCLKGEPQMKCKVVLLHLLPGISG